MFLGWFAILFEVVLRDELLGLLIFHHKRQFAPLSSRRSETFISRFDTIPRRCARRAAWEPEYVACKTMETANFKNPLP